MTEAMATGHECESRWSGSLGPLQPAVGTTAAQTSALDDAERERVRAAWEQLIGSLIDIGKKLDLATSEPDDDDDALDPPTEAAVWIAANIAREFRDAGVVPAMSRVGPDGCGGIQFERAIRSGFTEVLRIDERGKVEFVTYAPAPQPPVSRRTLFEPDYATT